MDTATPAKELSFDDLAWIWERAYQVERTDDGYRARIEGGRNWTLQAATTRELNALIKADLERRA